MTGSVPGTDNRGIRELGAEEKVGWDQVQQGVVLPSFEGDAADIAHQKAEERHYADFNSYTATVASWRVLKPVYNRDICIDCQNCWVWCPDTSIISRDKQMLGIDYDHCKGCGVCVEVCPTNPKSLLMFNEAEENEEALSEWPQKEKKAK
ncbi:4Fe-4S dicluster domain-containing protein [Sulfurovum sp.]|uniref:4Fe-4S dicluster domain-containing protein n=1 Tax=Sulfurovum sp. TaxID=1969726 RepID=UPI0025DD6720|nr:4Fe-4S dicluster domain-containing protein [Sulfurovum sp.]